MQGVNLFYTVVSNTEEDDNPRERKRRTSDSVVYVQETENEATAVILKLLQTEIKSHLERIERQAEEIQKLKEELKEAKTLKEITEGTIGKKNFRAILLCSCYVCVASNIK